MWNCRQDTGERSEPESRAKRAFPSREESAVTVRLVEVFYREKGKQLHQASSIFSDGQTAISESLEVNESRALAELDAQKSYSKSYG